MVSSVPPLLDPIDQDREIVPIQKVFRVEITFMYLVLEELQGIPHLLAQLSDAEAE